MNLKALQCAAMCELQCVNSTFCIKNIAIKMALIMNPKTLECVPMHVYAVRKLLNFIKVYFQSQCSQNESLRQLCGQPCMCMQYENSKILYYYISNHSTIKMNP